LQTRCQSLLCLSQLPLCSQYWPLCQYGYQCFNFIIFLGVNLKNSNFKYSFIQYNIEYSSTLLPFSLYPISLTGYFSNCSNLHFIFIYLEERCYRTTWVLQNKAPFIFTKVYKWRLNNMDSSKWTSFYLYKGIKMKIKLSFWLNTGM
jgi:hypothetical protein